MTQRWQHKKMALALRAKLDMQSLHRTQVSLYPDDGVRFTSARGVTSPPVKVNPNAALIEQALQRRKP